MVSILLATLLLAAPTDPQFWRYTDSNGHLYVTNDVNSIPAELRADATPFTPGVNQPEKAGARKEQASEAVLEQAFREGRLTEAELEAMISDGPLRTSILADSYRHAKQPEEETEQAGHSRLDALAHSGSPGTLSTVHILRTYLQDIRNSDKFWWSLAGQAAIIIAAIVALPFILRRYHTPETRRVVRASIFFSVIIISATGQLLLFRSETETLGRILMNLTETPGIISQELV